MRFLIEDLFKICVLRYHVCVVSVVVFSEGAVIALVDIATLFRVLFRIGSAVRALWPGVRGSAADVWVHVHASLLVAGEGSHVTPTLCSGGVLGLCI